jgi:hypothetical protein
MDRTVNGRSFRMLTIVGEFTRECLAIDVSRKLTSEDVLERLSDLFVRKGVNAGRKMQRTTVHQYAEQILESASVEK